MSLNHLAVFIAKCSSVLVCFIGLSVAVSWYADLTEWNKPFTPIQLNTSICFILSGFGLLAAIYHKSRVSLVCGLIIGTISALTLLEYGLDIDLKIDNLLLIPTQETVTGRMASTTALGLFFTAVMLLSIHSSSTKKQIFLTTLIASLLLILGVLPLVGYLSNIDTAYCLDQVRQNSISVTISFLLLGLGANAYMWHIDEQKTGIIFAVWCSTLAALVMFLLTLALWQQSLKNERISIQDKIALETNLIKHRIDNEVSSSVITLRRMGQRWANQDGVPQKAWFSDAKNYILDIQELQSIAWIQKKSNKKWIVSLADDKKQSALYQSMLAKTSNPDQIRLTPPIHLPPQGSHGFIAYAPIYWKQQFVGYIAGIYDTDRLVDRLFSPQMKALFSIKLTDSGLKLYDLKQETTLSARPYQMEIQLFNRTWMLSMTPKSNFLTQQISPIPQLELIFGSMFSFLMGVAIFFAITASRCSKEINEKSAALSRSERRQQQLVEEMQGHALYWINLKGNVESWNKGAENILGYKTTEILGKNYSVFFLTKEQKEGLPQQMIDTALDNKKFKTEIMLARKDGTKIWASVVLETVNSPTGELNGFAVIIQDISDLRLMELERNRLIAIIDESTDFIGMADLEDHLLYHNRGAKKMIGLPLDYDMSNMTVKDMHPAWAYNKINNVIMPIVLNQGSWSGESALVHQQTKIEIPVLQTIILHRDTQGNPLYLTTMMRDITERKNYEKALKHSEEIFRSAMEHAAIGMALVSVEGRWLKVNESLCHIFGFSEMDLLNNNFQAIAHQDDIKLDLDHIAQLLSGSISSYEVEKRYIRKDGATIWILLSVSLLRDVDNKPLYFIMQFQDIDSQKKAEEELKYFAYHDVLTGLANRKQLEAAFEMALTYAQRHNTYIAILFLDLDNFKEINDQHGHEIGDLLLLEVAARLRATVRASDILVRLGGDEFVIALTELADKQQAISVAKKIIDAITVPMTLKEHKIQVTASIGISLYPEDAQELKTLLKHADKALYSVKAEGKNNFGSFSR